ncbi:mechanosensitive ion channel family protein [Pseudomarimonas arenosa]|uniref:Mechanosensing system component YbdG n=1 Tax=Pseudomarimonas arenosa TaxID=2774145 RepID=A0AAW3ZHZ4_9GAMM|nr:mechanosensitive ion channel domain-containing protein [Pseudomarimonas arenosa]MBD8525705.1 mechanosensitive ion channel [Pseudomarimonas arenosa]
MESILQAVSSEIEANPWLATMVSLAGLILAAWLADLVTKRILLRLVKRIVRVTTVKWDDALLDRGVIDRVSHVVPALVIYWGVDLVSAISDDWVRVLRNVALSYIVLTLALGAAKLLGTVNSLYEARDTLRAKARPIKGYVQVAQLLIYLLSGIVIVAVLIERSPLLLLSGLGAMTAVLLLVFKDTLMSLVASIQLTSHDMLRVGDWIQMPALEADGDVIDIALHTVKVQNWDKTITTIPTYRLIAEPFRNWRGMSESGGRRIKRAVLIDQRSVRFLRDDERGRLSRFALIEDYLVRKKGELERWNESLRDAALEPVNTRRLTNLGTFRAYVEAYLRTHPKIHQNMTLLVRQLAPGPTGIPIELYCFTNTTAWAEYEGVQSDIFDHLLAILDEFDLRVFQEPGGADLRQALTGRRQ